MTVKTFDGQEYRLVRRTPYVRRDGGVTQLLVWESACATCGEPFELATAASASKFSPSRRCQRHKRPGQRVRKPAAKRAGGASR